LKIFIEQLASKNIEISQESWFNERK
jgi:hypothetical protein